MIDLSVPEGRVALLREGFSGVQIERLHIRQNEIGIENVMLIMLLEVTL